MQQLAPEEWLAFRRAMLDYHGVLLDIDTLTFDA
jgi:hypothetical protein